MCKCRRATFVFFADIARFVNFTLAMASRIHFPEGKSNITKFHISIAPKEGAYNGGTFVFDVNVPKRYPFAPPNVSCRTKIFHPNVNWQTGELSLGLLTIETWIPVLSINAIMFQLQVLIGCFCHFCVSCQSMYCICGEFAGQGLVPQLLCYKKEIFHPSVNWQPGEFSLGLLTIETWIPVLSINAIMFQLQVLVRCVCHFCVSYGSICLAAKLTGFRLAPPNNLASRYCYHVFTRSNHVDVSLLRHVSCVVYHRKCVRN